MNIVNAVIVGVIALLSLAAGAAKVFKAPQELAFFESLGVDLNIMIAFGTVQIAAGALTFLNKFRKIGAVIAAISFLISAAMIFRTEQIGFALFSILPVAFALYILRIPTPSISLK